jgi:hypothetical protein
MKYFISLVMATLFLGCGRTASRERAVDDSTPTPEVTVTASDDATDTVVVRKKYVEVTNIDAEDVLAAAMKTAAKEDKRVIVHLGAPW